jgi:hypothetical protein
MEGKTGVSLHTSFPMMKEGEPTFDESITIATKKFSGYKGDPYACSCAKDNEIVDMVRNMVINERTLGSQITEARSTAEMKRMHAMDTQTT